MDIDKSLRIEASPERIWNILLDPQAMAECVPGLQSVDVISPDEYAALMHVKIAFVSARFKLRTRIVERQAPHYLKAEGTGEDASVASSLKQVTQLTLTPQADGSTLLRIQVNVDLLGRMGSFGLSVMKTKADRLWDDFGVQLAGKLAAGGGLAEPPVAGSVSGTPGPAGDAVRPQSSPVASQAPHGPTSTEFSAPQGWWAGLLLALGIQPASASRNNEVIVVELQRPDQTRIRIEWPARQAQECLTWLNNTLN